MRRSWFVRCAPIAGAALLLALALLACLGTNSSGGASGNSGAVEVINHSSVEICYVYISPTTSSEWGLDQLGAENTIPAGSSFTIQNIPPGLYDLRADDCSNREIDTAPGVRVNAGQTVTWTFTDN